MQYKSKAHFIQFKGLFNGSHEQQDLWNVMWFVAVWTIWLMRNDLVLFNNVQPDQEKVVELIKFSSWQWITSRSRNFGYPFPLWYSNPRPSLEFIHSRENVKYSFFEFQQKGRTSSVVHIHPRSLFTVGKMLSADFRISVARENIQPCSHPHMDFIHNWENVWCPFSNFNSSKKLPALFTPNLGVYSQLGKCHVLLFRISVVGENIQHYSHPLWEFIHS